jgi:hydroxymethylpyrimidine/phosphomethylpyrimidine kinase
VTTPWLLVVAGHDPSGGAGVSADEEAARASEFEVRTVITAHTNQSDAGVVSVGARPAIAWLQDARALLGDHPAAIKFGLLPGADHLRAAAELIREAPGIPIVVDPLIESSSGFEFLDAAALEVLRTELLPLPVILTPNLPEAARLTARPELGNFEDREAAAHELLAPGLAAVLLKGGHGMEDPIRELLLTPATTAFWLEHPRLPGRGIRGSGCRHATTLACALARGLALPEAARHAAEHVASRIRATIETS